MELLGVQALDSPNIYSLDQKVILMRVKLRELVDTPTKDIDGFNERILQLFPGLIEHKCTKGYRGGFIDRLQEGTYLAHVTEHLCLETEIMLGSDVKFGKARREQDDIYKIIFACENLSVGKACAYFVFDVVNKLINKEEILFAEGYHSLVKIRAACDRGVSTGAILDEAHRRGIPAGEAGDGALIRLGYGKYQKYIAATLVENTSSIAADISCDKGLTKILLSEVSIPVPEGKVCYTLNDALQCAQDIGWPVVAKPKTGSKGRFVSVNINSRSELEKAFLEAQALGPEVIIEKYITGKDYRLLVVNGKMVAAAERIPARVIGDGRNTLKNLIDMENSSVLRGDDHEKPLTKIRIDEHVLGFLAKNGLSLDSIPEPGQIIYLRSNSNLSTGGTAVDCTAQIHPRNQEIAELAAKTIGLDIAGIDMIIPDISQPMGKDYGAVVEVNAAPGIRMHLQPAQGQSRDVASAILDMIYPPGSKHSIPITAITGTNGKTTTTRLLNHILKQNGHSVGMTTTHGIFVNDTCLEEGDTTGYQSAQRILNNRQIDMAVLETARGGIINHGLGYQRADVAVFTNLANDHLGINNINSLEELFHVKSLVTEAVKPEGYCVLNADDPWTLKAREKAGGKVILFSLNPNNPHLRRHIQSGGWAVFAENNAVYTARNGEINYVIDIKDIPATLEGILQHNIYNCLAAAGAAFALGIPVITISKALRTFSCEPEMNPGRFNIYELDGFKVILDYGHNYDGYRVTIDALKKLQTNRLIGVIGVPGDRRNEDIQEVGKLAGKAFDQLIIKEDHDLRGRKPLDTALLLQAGAWKSSAKRDIQIIPSEEEALEYALNIAHKGDLIAVFFEQRDPLVKIIKRYKAKKSLRSEEADILAGKTEPTGWKYAYPNSYYHARLSSFPLLGLPQKDQKAY